MFDKDLSSIGDWIRDNYFWKGKPRFQNLRDCDFDEKDLFSNCKTFKGFYDSLERIYNMTSRKSDKAFKQFCAAMFYILLIRALYSGKYFGESFPEDLLPTDDDLGAFEKYLARIEIGPKLSTIDNLDDGLIKYWDYELPRDKNNDRMRIKTILHESGLLYNYYAAAVRKYIYPLINQDDIYDTITNNLDSWLMKSKRVSHCSNNGDIKEDVDFLYKLAKLCHDGLQSKEDIQMKMNVGSIVAERMYKTLMNPQDSSNDSRPVIIETIPEIRLNKKEMKPCLYFPSNGSYPSEPSKIIWCYGDYQFIYEKDDPNNWKLRDKRNVSEIQKCNLEKYVVRQDSDNSQSIDFDHLLAAPFFLFEQNKEDSRAITDRDPIKDGTRVVLVANPVKDDLLFFQESESGLTKIEPREEFDITGDAILAFEGDNEIEVGRLQLRLTDALMIDPETQDAVPWVSGKRCFQRPPLSAFPNGKNYDKVTINGNLVESDGKVPEDYYGPVRVVFYRDEKKVASFSYWLLPSDLELLEPKSKLMTKDQNYDFKSLFLVGGEQTITLKAFSDRLLGKLTFKNGLSLPVNLEVNNKEGVYFHFDLAPTSEKQNVAFLEVGSRSIGIVCDWEAESLKLQEAPILLLLWLLAKIMHLKCFLRKSSTLMEKPDFPIMILKYFRKTPCLRRSKCGSTWWIAVILIIYPIRIY